MHKRLLVEAELARVRGRPMDAMSLYDEALELARTNGFHQEEALASELAGRFYLEQGRPRVARAYLVDALYEYRKWNARAICGLLEKEFPEFLARAQEEGAFAGQPASVSTTTTVPASTVSSTSSSGGRDRVDVATVLKVSQVISGEIRLERLLERMMGIVVENAGAQRGLLLLESDDRLYIEAEAGSEEDDIQVLQHIPVADKKDVAHAVLNYVMRMGETVVLDDAAKAGGFSRDTYVMTRLPRSVICLPLKHQTRLRGILYLENNLATGVFTPRRVEVLQMIATEIVISLENARLYASLEKQNRKLEGKVREKNRELLAARQTLREESGRFDQVLRAICPDEVAAQWHERGEVTPRDASAATVLYAELVNLWGGTHEWETGDLVTELGRFRQRFRETVEEHGLLGIHAPPNGVVAVSGLMSADEQHAVRSIRAARALVARVEAQDKVFSPELEVRLGLHSGPVVGGIIDSAGGPFELFGEGLEGAMAVARHARPMSVAVAESTRLLSSDRFHFDQGGSVVRDDGREMATFLVRGELPSD